MTSRQQRSTFRRVLWVAAPVAMILFAAPVFLSAADAWQANFGPTEITVKSAGEYKMSDGRTAYFESFSPLELEPSMTAGYLISNGQVTFEDTEPALRPNPNAPPTYVRAEGTISALTWVEGKFGDVRMTGEFNTARDKAFSRQGLLARWDQGNNHYWFYVNFSTGQFGIVRSRFFGVLMADLDGSAGPIADFKNTKTYYLEFELRGAVAHGWVYEHGADGSRTLVGDTGDITDSDPFLAGVSGTLIELWEETPFIPLRGSFANITATPIVAEKTGERSK